MGKKCCVSGCKSGYASVKPEREKVSFFSFPNDPDLRNEWLDKIQRPDYEPTQNSTVCSLHFEETDLQIYSQDVSIRRKKSRLTDKLLQKRLVPNAVPSLNPKFPCKIKKVQCLANNSNFSYFTL